MPAAIEVENLGKKYRVPQPGTHPRYRTLRESLAGAIAFPWRRWRQRQVRLAAEEFWALRDVSFTVEPGDVLGIIGRNGAGKSTLLKILARITRPTTGRAELAGRVGSLLEVGTGFHPDLTGRENIYLNGSLLGLRRREIASRFDQIVAFAEIESFLDLPVKRYSSGMYLRLGFSIAAHLHPEILIVDEVLAVGDAAFQKRCLARMTEVSRSGRTVLFVSHNLSSIRSLCRSAIIMERGRLIGQGSPESQVAQYLARLAEAASRPLEERLDRDGNGRARITGVQLLDPLGNYADHICAGDPLTVAIAYQASRPGASAVFGLSCWSAEGQKLFQVSSLSQAMTVPVLAARGEHRCTFPRLPLVPGTYQLHLRLAIDGEVADHVPAAASFVVLPGHFYGTMQPAHAHGGVMFIDHSWS